MDHASQYLLDTSLNLAEDINLSDHLIYRHVREGRGSRVALLYQDAQFTYAQVAGLVSRAATLLRKDNVKTGDRVLILLPDNPSFVVWFFAALHVGAIAVPVNPALPASDVVHIALHVGAKIAFIDGSLVGKFEPLARSGVSIVPAGDCYSRWETLDEHLASIGEDSLGVNRIANAVAYCLYSSGTTGAPKGIPHRHIDIIECIKAYSLPILRMSAEDRVLAVPKLTFGYGLGGNLLSAFYVGGTSILLSDPSTGSSIAKAALLHKPTLFLGQPRMIADLLQNPLPDAFHRLRLAVTAGEVLVPALYQRWREAVDVELLDGFGSTEVGHVFISNSVGDVRPGCSGRVVPGFEVKILDDTGAPVPEKTIGHLWVRGPSLTTGYWNDDERTRQYFLDGWARTGDLFQRDEDGYLYMRGRADDMIKAGCGQWISPIEVEALLQEDEVIADCAVVGYSDAYGLVRPKAYVVLQPNHRPSVDIEQRLKQIVSERWPELPHKHLGTVEFVSMLPRGSTGKLQRFRLNPATLTEFSYEC